MSTVGYWFKFNAVGLLGVGVQLGSLVLFREIFRLPYLIATLLAVEAAVLHNFVWHERWTWRDRSLPQTPQSIFGRALGFHISAGAVSICGNLIFMWILAAQIGLHYLLSNIVAICICSLFNFFVSHSFIFHDKPRELPPVF